MALLTCHKSIRSSPSSRRAWIEIGSACSGRRQTGVALLAEGVDRNKVYIYETMDGGRVALLAEGVDRNKLPVSVDVHDLYVALLAEGVDRNYPPIVGKDRLFGRPPRGGRG